MSMLLGLVLQEKYFADPNREPVHMTSRRFVTVDLTKADERQEVCKFHCSATKRDEWGLGNEVDGWWRIVEAYEWVEPTEDLHEDRFPVAYALDMPYEFENMVIEANNGATARTWAKKEGQ